MVSPASYYFLFPVRKINHTLEGYSDTIANYTFVLLNSVLTFSWVLHINNWKDIKAEHQAVFCLFVCLFVCFNYCYYLMNREEERKGYLSLPYYWFREDTYSEKSSLRWWIKERKGWKGWKQSHTKDLLLFLISSFSISWYGIPLWHFYSCIMKTSFTFFQVVFLFAITFQHRHILSFLPPVKDSTCRNHDEKPGIFSVLHNESLFTYVYWCTYRLCMHT